MNNHCYVNSDYLTIYTAPVKNRRKTRRLFYIIDAEKRSPENSDIVSRHNLAWLSSYVGNKDLHLDLTFTILKLNICAPYIIFSWFGLMNIFMVWFDVYNNITLTPDRLRSWVSVMSYKSDYLGLEHSRPGLPPHRVERRERRGGRRAGWRGSRRMGWKRRTGCRG